MTDTKQQFRDPRRTPSRINAPLPKGLPDQRRIIFKLLKIGDKEEIMKAVKKDIAHIRGIKIKCRNYSRLLFRNYARQKTMELQKTMEFCLLPHNNPNLSKQNPIASKNVFQKGRGRKYFPEPKPKAKKNKSE